jgi:hypothetical protein
MRKETLSDGSFTLISDPPPCIDCKFANLKARTCKAFPDGIPREIISGDNQHTKPLPDQKNKVVFEPIK